MVVIVSGLPGAGKTYLASRLVSLIDAVYIQSDRVRKALVGKGAYSKMEKLSIYDEMAKLLHQALGWHKNVVLDATFWKKDMRRKFLDKAETAGVVVVIEVTADEKLIKERLSRKRADSEADIRVYELLREQWEPWVEPHLILESTNDNIDGMLAQAIRYIHSKAHDETAS